MATDDETRAAAFEERREHERYQLMAQVRVKHGRVDYVLELINISLSGALLELGSLARPPWVEKGRTVEIALLHPETFEAIEVEGRIVRAEGGESGASFAVKFSRLPPAAELQVAALVELGHRRQVALASVPLRGPRVSSPAEQGQQPPGERQLKLPGGPPPLPRR